MDLRFFLDRVIEKKYVRLLCTVLALFTLTTFSIFAQTTYTLSGSYTPPAGVTKVLVECWGGGGGGATVTTAVRGGGGGGGAYSRGAVSVTAGNQYDFVVGAGGTPSSAGGDTYFNVADVKALGGAGGTENSNSGASGGSGLFSIGDVKYAGGNGGTGTSSYSGGGGGGAGDSNPGGNGSGSSRGTGGLNGGGNGAAGSYNAVGKNAAANGGGGSGACRVSGSGTRLGGSGFRGQIRITPIYVEVRATLGVTAGYYASLSSAVAAITAGTHKGDIDVKILSSTTETTTTTFPATGGTASYTSIHVYPIADNITISGSIPGDLISLNGASNVSIDGRLNGVGSTRSLTIVNTNTGTSSTTVKFIGGAAGNAITYCTLKGGVTGTDAVGTVFFSTGANTGNSINNCEITNNGTRRTYAILSSGTASSGNTVSDNLIYNTWKLDASSYSINLGSGTSGWSITGNSFYDTGLSTLSASATYSAIYIANTSNTSAYTITGNYIGGSAVACGNTALTIGTSGTVRPIVFIPIYLSVNTSPISLVQYNSIKNIDLLSSSATPFTGITLISGSAQINGNTIGDQTGSTNTRITTSVNSTSYGIDLTNSNASSQVEASSNILSKITLASTGTTYSHSFAGIYNNSNQSATVVISGNTIGHASTLNSIVTAASSGSLQNLYGIYSNGPGTNSIFNNTVANLSNTASATSNIVGIYTGTGKHTVYKNFIHSLSCTSTSSNVYGVNIVGSSSLMAYYNNIISLGNTSTGGVIYGVHDTGGSSYTTNFYHNTIYISGTASAASSYAFYNASTNNIRDYRNNVLYNVRSSTGANYAIYYYYTGTSSLTSDYNTYVVSGATNYVGYYSTNVDLSGLQSTGKDANSSVTNPGLALAGGLNAADYKVQNQLVGSSGISGVTDDFGGISRSVFTCGAWEFFSINLLKDGVFQQSYPTLKGVFDKINDGTWKGNLAIEVNGSTLETASAVLNASGTGSASYSSLRIYPLLNNLSITGNFNNPLINLNSAKNVCINGSVLQGNSVASLTLKNTYNGSNASVIQFTESTQNDSIEYCLLSGAPSSVSRGVVTFLTTTGTGNNTNIIDNCKISGTGAGSSMRPYNAIYSIGASGHINTGNEIKNNVFFDFLNQAATSNGIFIDNYSSAFTISGNSFYETSSFTSTSTGAYALIRIYSPNGNGFSVVNNRLGGSAVNAIGTWVKTGSNNAFYGIHLSVGNTSASIVEGNVIKNFNYTNSSTSDWTGIYIASGNVVLGKSSGNTIGEATGTNSIYLTNGNSDGHFYGIYIASTEPIDCENTVMGSINVGATLDLACSFYGIYKAAGGGDLQLINNLIGGSTTDESLKARSISANTTQLVYGIFSQGSGYNYFYGNEVANLMNATVSDVNSLGNRCLTRGIYTGDGSNDIINNKVYKLTTSNNQSGNYLEASIIGILCGSTSDGYTQNVKGNAIYKLINPAEGSIEMYGIFYNGPASGSNEISRNFVHTFDVVTNNDAYLHGISLYEGTYTCYNNVVFLGNNIKTGCRIWGIWNSSNRSIKILNNTVYLSGQATSGTSNSYAFRDLSEYPTDRTILNNIFWNGRTNTSAISHYAIFLNATANTVLNYNDYQFAQNFGVIVSASYSSLALWKSANPSFDVNSIQVDPLLTNLGGVNPSDYQAGSSSLSGTYVSQVTTDFGFMDRSSVSPTMGAWEYVSSPVEVWNGTTFRADYKTLKDAFDKINTGVWTGDITIKIKANITETSMARLYQSGYTGGGGTSSYTSIHIIPTRSNIQVLGALTSSLIELNGASGVVFDGRVDGTGSPYNLILQNSNQTTSASTISLVNSASSNIVEYCLVKGLSTNTSGGIVQLLTSSAGNGVDNNIIQNNQITTIGSDPTVRVVNAIYSEGTLGRENTGNQLLNNQIYDVWRQGSSSYAIQIGANSTNYTISGNSIYETSSFVPAGAYTYQGIRINNTSGNDFVVSGNYIGGKALQCQGAALSIGTTTTANTFVLQPIYLNIGTGTGASVQGNTITNIQVTSPNTASFAALYINSGVVNAGTETGNTIGSGVGIGSISLVGVSATSASYGVFVNGVSNVDVSNNVIGSITTSTNATTSGHSFYAIYKSSGTGSFNVAGNSIGSPSTSGSINASSASTSSVQAVYGIYAIGTGQVTLSNNSISYIKNSSTYNLAGNDVISIYFGGSTNTLNSIQRNFVYNLEHASTTVSAVNKMVGIYLLSGSVTVSNNILWIGNGTTGNYSVNGIYDVGVAGQTNKFYHNTVYLTGAPSNTSPNSYAYVKTVAAGTTDIRNNVFYNARTAGNTAKHYALSLAGISGVTINSNDYICSGATFKNYLNATEYTLLSNWKSAVSQDAVSLNITPFAIPASASAILFRPILDLNGTSVSVISDYALNPRNATTPTMGAWERVNKWKGNISIDFNTSGNWTFNMVPATDDNIIFDDAPLRPCVVDQDRSVMDVLNNQPTHKLVVNGNKLTLKGRLVFTNGAQIDASAVGSILEFSGLSAQTIPSGSLYNDMVYNLTINNANNVVLNGTLSLLNALTATNGRLDASSVGALVSYAGSVPQTIESGRFYNDGVHGLQIKNTTGVTLNSSLAVANDLSILSGSSLSVKEDKGLTVLGTLTNQVGPAGLVLLSSSLGTASLIHNSNNVQATVKRYIGGDSLAWHFISSPVSAQAMTGAWTPVGAYGDGTGYDLYLWDEPKSCWVYNLNTDSVPAWSSANPGNTFIPGRGYLYAVQELNPTKQFVGGLNNGAITRALTIGASGSYKGFNLIGNPYPSSIDWSLAAGFSRSMLYLNGSGYDIWTWSPTANNYGVFNSADVTGTNNVTRYIAPMQAFYVRAASAGSFGFNNASRVHTGASAWLKSTKLEEAQDVRLSVSSTSGSDEVKFGFGYPSNESGAIKLFSPVETAPSLYMNCAGVGYSTRRLTDKAQNKYIPINFKAGDSGTYELRANFDGSSLGTVYLEDRLTGAITDLSQTDHYEFHANVDDKAERFIIHFGSVTPVDSNVHPNVWVSAGMLNVYLENMIGDFVMTLLDLQGRTVLTRKMSGGEQCSVPLFARGVSLVKVDGESKSHSVKVLY